MAHNFKRYSNNRLGVKWISQGYPSLLLYCSALFSTNRKYKPKSVEFPKIPISIL